jgi:hypothetical protein
MGSSRLYRKNSSQRTIGKIYSAEGKYTYVIFGRWHGRGRSCHSCVRRQRRVRAMDDGGRVEELLCHYAIAAAACRQAVESSCAKATEEIEAHIPARGRVLLSVDATNGDTMFFAPVKPDIAQRWRDKASRERDVCRAGVCSPMDLFSVHTPAPRAACRRPRTRAIHPEHACAAM